MFFFSFELFSLPPLPCLTLRYIVANFLLFLLFEFEGWKLEICSFLIMIWDFKLMALRLHIVQTKSTGFLKEDARRWR